MRSKQSIASLLIALIVATLSARAQETPLPRIHAKGSTESLTIPLPIETESPSTQSTLIDAARANDYVLFDTLYRDSIRRGESVAQFVALHELWTYGVTNPTGAFYGIETYERLARQYSGYASYIESYRIIDNQGNVFYPTSETRAFLLDRALEAVQREQQGSDPGGTLPSVIPRKSSVVVVKKPRAVAEERAVVVEEKPRVAVSPIAKEPPITQPIIVNDGFGRRGFLLLFVGILGVGVLAVMLRAPRALPPSISSVDRASGPIRRPSAAPPPPSGKNRASGSHG